MRFKLEDKFILSIFKLLKDGSSSTGVDGIKYKTSVIDGPLDRIVIYSDNYSGFTTIEIIYLAKIVFFCNIEDGRLTTHVFENGHWVNTIARYLDREDKEEEIL